MQLIVNFISVCRLHIHRIQVVDLKSRIHCFTINSMEITLIGLGQQFLLINKMFLLYSIIFNLAINEIAIFIKMSFDLKVTWGHRKK